MSFPRCPSPCVNNREKKLLRYEQAVEKCRKEWTTELEKTNFNLGVIYIA